MQRAIVLVAVLVAAAVGAWMALRGPSLPHVGTVYADAGALGAEMTRDGFVKMGEFGDGWPAEVAEVTAQEDAITFTVGKGSPNVYDAPAYAGYRFVLVRLTSNATRQPFARLYRSKDKVK